MKKKRKRKPPSYEYNAQAPIFGDERGGRCERYYEPLNHRLRRLYSEDTEVWSSYEVGKPVYTRVELTYQRKVFVGVGHDEEAGWRDLARQLPHIDEDMQFRFVGVRDWFIVYLFTEDGAWRCEGTTPLVIMEKLLKCAKRCRPTVWGQ